MHSWWIVILCHKPQNLPELRLHIYIPISFFIHKFYLCLIFSCPLSIYKYDFCDSLKIHTTSTMPKKKYLQIMNPAFGIRSFYLSVLTVTLCVQIYLQQRTCDKNRKYICNHDRYRFLHSLTFYSCLRVLNMSSDM